MMTGGFIKNYRGIFAILICVVLSLDAVQADVTVDLPVEEDSWVHSNTRRVGDNFGSDGFLTVKGDERIPYLKFRPVGVAGTVTSVQLHIWSQSVDDTVNVFTVADSTWTEDNIRWNNRPPLTTPAIASEIATPGAWVVISLPLDTVTNGELLSLALTTAGDQRQRFRSKEGEPAAFLRVSFSDTNIAPVAGNNTFLVLQDSQRLVSSPGILSDDIDENRDPLTAELIEGPSNGQLTLNGDGSFTYLPNAGFLGTDSFTYRANDQHQLQAGGTSTLSSDPATVSLVVSPSSILLNTAERTQIENDLGITLSQEHELDLILAVNPLGSPTWLNSANQRINQHRKANWNLTIVDSQGQPVPDATVSLTPLNRPFDFGGILNLKVISGDEAITMPITDYRNIADSMFDTFGLDNGLKPKLRNGNEADLPGFFSWASSLDKPVRGHLLLWPGGTHLSAPVQAIVDQIEESDDAAFIDLKKVELKQAIDAEIEEWAGLWDVYEWDVLNEILSNQTLQNILGRDEMIHWFELAEEHQMNPEARRLLNDFQIISGRDNSRLDRFKDELDFLIAGGAPLDAIGFQSRFKFQREDPDLIYSRLQEFDQYELPLIGTEFEIKDNPGVFEPSEYLRGQMTAEIMTVYFSHEKTFGLHAWDFIREGSNKSLLNSDGTPKLNGLVWYYLSKIRFRTRNRFTTDGAGSFSKLAFKGQYQINVSWNGETHVTTLDLDEPASDTIVTPFLLPQPSEFSLSPIEDTFAHSGLPDSTFGERQVIDLRSDPFGNFTRYGYLKFDLLDQTSALLDPTLSLTITNGSGTIEVYLVDDSSWTENSLTWSNSPTLGALVGSAQAAIGEIEIPLTGLPSGRVFSLALVKTDDAIGKVASRESGTPPALNFAIAPLDSDDDQSDDSIDPDDDNDGLPDRFENLYELDPLTFNPPQTDTDRDSYPDLVEYWFLSSPADASSRPMQLSWTTAGKMRLSYRVRTTDDPLITPPMIEFSTDLSSWHELKQSELDQQGYQLDTDLTNPGSDANSDYNDREMEVNGAPKMFLRIKTSTPPTP